MKKAIALVLALILCLALAGCGAVTEQPAETVAETTAAPLLEVEITLENWQDYFEMREAQRVQVNEKGAVVLREFGYGLFLKEEYAADLAETDVSFDMKANSIRYQVYGDLTTDNFIVRDDVIHNEGEVTITAPLEDLRGNTRIEVDSDLYDTVSAFFTIDGEFGA